MGSGFQERGAMSLLWVDETTYIPSGITLKVLFVTNLVQDSV